ncbi:DoxX family protein [Umezawaea endophytica]|uniref:DoxX family protein n=1 Tax=Umezawaea endophytica TaxID=1654476 RepID=A0A9X2VID3_9PSEU|nr:DoxX family protein [Umezawaea endophytica]MCS7477260.1 DoxX family protein [Umezawaea endophytica]
MTATPLPTARNRAVSTTFVVLRVLVALMFVVASAGPKFFGEVYAVEIFTEIGAGQWFRYLVGFLELAGGVGLLVPRLVAPAAIGLVGLMVGAAFTQVVILDNPAFVVTPVVLGVLCGLIAWHHRASLRTLLSR